MTRPSRSNAVRHEPTPAAPTVELAAELERAGRLRDAIDALMVVNRARPDSAVERQLVRLRHRAHRHVTPPAERPSFPALGPAPASTTPSSGLPRIHREDLDPAVLRAGLLQHGCLHIDALVPTDRVTELVDTIDRAFTAADEFAAGRPVRETTPWFEPFRPGPGFEDQGPVLGRKRKWVRDGGGVWAADSPRGLFLLLDTLEDVGLTQVITDYLGEQPLLSVNKCTLRRVGLDTSTDWHQDGAFLGESIRTVNVWMALTDCGVEAPGLDVVPSRLDRVVETGSDGAWFDWAVAPAIVEEVTAEAGTAVIRPTFRAGDVLLFDQLFLHRTAVDPAMTTERYAIETWFFGPSTYPGTQVPLVP